MKIRIEVSSLATSSPSGVANYTRQLAESLGRNEDISIVGSYFNFLNRKPTNNLPKIKLEKNSIIPLKIFAKLDSYNIRLPFDLFKSRVDLTIFPNFVSWKSVKTKLTAVVVHDLTFLYFPELVDEKNLEHLRRTVPRSLNESDIVITVSEAVKSEIVKEFSIDPQKIIVTQIPADSVFYVKNKENVHDKYKIPTEKYIYFIGNLEPRKDIPTLVEAYTKLPKNIKAEYSLAIAGKIGWKAEKTQKYIDNAISKGENVVQLGRVSSVTDLSQQASLFVMPSLYEGFGMPILESMASHVPVLTSDIPVLRETGGEAAVYAKKGDSSDFSRKMLEMLTDQKLRDSLEKKSQINLKRFSWEKNAQNIFDQSSKLLNHDKL